MRGEIKMYANYFAFFLTITTVLGIVSYFAFKKIPITIGCMVSAIILIFVSSPLLPYFGYDASSLHTMLIGFDVIILSWILPYLLFAGGLELNLKDLIEQKIPIAYLAIIGVLISTIIFTPLFYFSIKFIFNINTHWLASFLAGLILSATDPIAALGLRQVVKLNKKIESIIVGESLGNDGTVIVVFTIVCELLVKIYESGGKIQGASSEIVLNGLRIFCYEVTGSIGLGMVIGYLSHKILKKIDNYVLEIMISITIAFAGYQLATALHLSGAIYVVVVGLLMGNYSTKFAMSPKTIHNLEKFWMVTDGVLNMVVFSLTGLAFCMVDWTMDKVLIGILAYAFSQISRWVNVKGFLYLLSFGRKKFSKGDANVIFWGGLRGAVSIALAVVMYGMEGIPLETRELVLSTTTIAVSLSILVQGISMLKVVRKNHEKYGGIIMES